MKRILPARLALPFFGVLMCALPMNASATCALKDEYSALNVRMLQTELMVAALSCNKNDSYNRFVRRFEPNLIKNGKALKAYFERSYDKQGFDTLNRFITRAANQASEKSLHSDINQYCQRSMALFEKTLSASPESLLTLAGTEEYANRHGFRPCDATPRYAQTSSRFSVRDIE